MAAYRSKSSANKLYRDTVIDDKGMARYLLMVPTKGCG